MMLLIYNVISTLVIFLFLNLSSSRISQSRENSIQTFTEIQNDFSKNPYGCNHHSEIIVAMNSRFDLKILSTNPSSKIWHIVKSRLNEIKSLDKGDAGSFSGKSSAELSFMKHPMYQTFSFLAGNHRVIESLEFILSSPASNEAETKYFLDVAIVSSSDLPIFFD